MVSKKTYFTDIETSSTQYSPTLHIFQMSSVHIKWILDVGTYLGFGSYSRYFPMFRDIVFGVTLKGTLKAFIHA